MINDHFLKGRVILSAKHLASAPGFKEKLSGVPLRAKKIFAVVCAAAVIGAAVPAAVFTADARISVTASTTAYLNMRSGPGNSYSVVKTIPLGQEVIISDRTYPRWLKVRLSDGSSGYCLSDYLDIKTDCITSTDVNLRVSPDTSSRIIQTIKKDTILDILDFSGTSWAYVKLKDGTRGYVHTAYVEYVDPNAAVSGGTQSGSSSGQTPSSSQSSVKVSISQQSNNLAVGNRFQLTASTNSGGKITWSSSDKNVARVESDGMVYGLTGGNAKITAKDSKTGVTVSCQVKVVATEFRLITLPTRTLSMKPGSQYKIKAGTVPEGKESSIKYRSENDSVATVSSAGIIKAVGAGTVWITCYDPTDTVTSSIKLTVTNGSASSGSTGTDKTPSQTSVSESSTRTSETKPAETKPEPVAPTISISSETANVRQGSSVRLTAKLSDNSSVKWSSSNVNIASVRNGVVSGLKPGTATITASDSKGLVTAECVVTVGSVSSSGISVSRSTASTNVGKTLYITGYCSKSADWQTSDSNVATVREGFVYAKAPGKVAISYNDNNGNRAVCVVTIYAAEPIKFTYSSPNSATVGTNVKLVAITDKNRSKVRFTVIEDGVRNTVYATEKRTEDNTYVWTANYKVTKPGAHNYIAYAYTGSTWITCNDGKADIWVTDKSDPTVSGLEKLRASDEVIKFIGDKEGFVSDITYDTLANNIPTIAHGYVVWEGQSFYDHMTKGEGYALLVKAVNEDSYSSRVNTLLINEGIYFNQQQFDALVSFSYNLGTGWSYGSDLLDILRNSYGPSTSNTGTVTGKVNANGGLNLRKSYTTSSDVIRVLNNGETVTLVSTQKYNGVWYKVKTSKGETGYCSGTYLNLSTSGSTVRDLKYVNKNALITELLAYHHAGGVCYYGLLYRRADELEMFLYGDYAPDGRSNKYGFPDPYCLAFP